ncbi:thioredoxin-dependent thiol peroxidase [Halosquirtibacter laminarini]|uniref:Thioredoxin-dependent thiol peroxidase n=1 Tax=Halosquirtibacter laminarini TaxID=3374600 RepID=A0AC61NGR3_9BACT|nr:thioredoxin-dependent thiol peroxidase [Prolixibacteraceae bacterium]
MTTISIGDVAPSFEGVDQNNRIINSESLRGKKVILYFYPKDNTPGCTAEACNLSDNYKFWQKHGYEVIGVSPDTIASHKKFEQKHGLPFTLIADTEKVILEAYGSWGLKKLYGREYMGVIRKTFVIDEAGKIVAIFEKVKTKTHSKQLADHFELELE